MSETVSLPACIMGGPHDGRTMNVEATVPPVGRPMPPDRIILAAEMRVSLNAEPEELFGRYAYDFVGFSEKGAVYHYTELRRGAGSVGSGEDTT